MRPSRWVAGLLVVVVAGCGRSSGHPRAGPTSGAADPASTPSVPASAEADARDSEGDSWEWPAAPDAPDVGIADDASPDSTATDVGSHDPAVERSRGVEWLGHAGGAISAMAVDGSRVFLGQGPEVGAWDATDPARPRRVGAVLLPDPSAQVISLAVLGDTVLAGTGASGYRPPEETPDGPWKLWVLDFSEPSQPSLRGSYPSPPFLEALAAAGSLVFTNNMELIDCSDPSACVFRPVVLPPERAQVHDVQIRGDRLFAFTRYGLDGIGRSGVVVYDISEPDRPTFVAFFGCDACERCGEDEGAALGGDYAYLLCHGEGRSGQLRVVDLRDPEYRVVGVLALDGGTWQGMRAAVVGRELHLFGDDVHGILDVSQATAPAPSRKSTDALFRDVETWTAVGGFLYVSDWEGLHVVPPSGAQEAPAPNTLQGANAVTVVDHRAYVIQGEDGPAGNLWGRLGVVDVADPAVPQLIDSRRFHEDQSEMLIGTDLAIAGDRLYTSEVQCEFGAAACWGSLGIWTLSSSGPPARAGRYDFPDERQRREAAEEGDGPPSWAAWAMTVSGTRAYLVGGPNAVSSALVVLDVAQSARARPVASIDLPSWSACGIAVSAGYAYVTPRPSWSDEPEPDPGLRVFDISRSDRPVEVAAVDSVLGDVVVVAGSFAYLAGGRDGSSPRLTIVDVGDPLHPVEVGSIGLAGETHDFVVADGLAYVAAGEAGLRVIDVSRPAAPVEIAFFVTPEASAVAVEDGIAYLMDRRGGMFVLRVERPSAAGADAAEAAP